MNMPKENMYFSQDNKRFASLALKGFWIAVLGALSWPTASLALITDLPALSTVERKPKQSHCLIFAMDRNELFPGVSKVNAPIENWIQGTTKKNWDCHYSVSGLPTSKSYRSLAELVPDPSKIGVLSKTRYESLIAATINRIKEGYIKKGDDLAIVLSSHGTYSPSKLEPHKFECGNELCELKNLAPLMKAAQEHGVSITLIDDSCYSGSTLSLFDPNSVCILSGTTANSISYASASGDDTFADIYTKIFQSQNGPSESMTMKFQVMRQKSELVSIPQINTRAGLCTHSILTELFSYNLDGQGTKNICPGCGEGAAAAYTAAAQTAGLSDPIRLFKDTRNTEFAKVSNEFYNALARSESLRAILNDHFKSELLDQISGAANGGSRFPDSETALPKGSTTAQTDSNYTDLLKEYKDLVQRPDPTKISNLERLRRRFYDSIRSVYPTIYGLCKSQFPQPSACDRHFLNSTRTTQDPEPFRLESIPPFKSLTIDKIPDTPPQPQENYPEDSEEDFAEDSPEPEPKPEREMNPNTSTNVKDGK